MKKKNKKREKQKELGERDILDMETNIWKATCGLYIALDRWIVVRKNLETPNKAGNSKNAPVWRSLLTQSLLNYTYARRNTTLQN